MVYNVYEQFALEARPPKVEISGIHCISTNEFNKYFMSLSFIKIIYFGDFLPSGNILSIFMEDCTRFKVRIYIYITLISPGQGHLPKRAEMKT